jgi:hypothetical protein
MILSDTFVWPLLLARRGCILQLQEGISAAARRGCILQLQEGISAALLAGVVIHM